MTNTARIEKDKYYLNIAEQVSERSTCLTKHWGAVIVKDDVIISTGFNGAPRKMTDCITRGYCPLNEYRRKNSLGRGTAYEYCPSVHSEMNAMLFADKKDMKGATLYLVGKEMTSLDGGFSYVTNPAPCSICKKLIINAGIDKVITRLSPDNAEVFIVDHWSDDKIMGGY